METGRTHQIRVHSKHINHPILGRTEKLHFEYTSNKFNRLEQKIDSNFKYLDEKIDNTKNKLELKIDLPDDMKKIIE